MLLTLEDHLERNIIILQLLLFAKTITKKHCNGIITGR